MGKRRLARECALDLLYEIEIKKIELSDIKMVEETLRFYWEHKDPSLKNNKFFDSIKQFTEEIVYGVLKNLENIDQHIKIKTENWDISRIAKVEKNVMRIAIFEILHLKNIPIGVIINEAVEISRKYGSLDSDKFVNGVLGNIKKEKIEIEKTTHA